MKKLNATGAIVATMNTNATDTCQCCGVHLEPITLMGHTIHRVTCDKCLDAIDRRRERELAAERLKAWAQRSGLALAQLREAKELGIAVSEKIAGITEPGSEAFGAFLYGPTGTGKTMHAMAFALSQATRRLKSDVNGAMPYLRYMTEERAFSKLSAHDVGEELRQIRECDVLILDDIGAHPGTQREASRLTDALVERMAERRTTILISNYNVADLMARGESGASRVWGARMVERVLHMTCMSAVVHHTTPHRSNAISDSRDRVAAMIAAMNQQEGA